MADSMKEQILQAIESLLLGIKAGSTPALATSYQYMNTVSYVDRQYLEFDEEEVINHPMPWIIVNNEGEEIEPLPGKHFQSKLEVQIVGFVKLPDDSENLDSLMNSLQKDIFIAILSDVNLSGKASYIVPRSVVTVPEMINPYGGFVLHLDVIYNFSGLNY